VRGTDRLGPPDGRTIECSPDADTSSNAVHRSAERATCLVEADQ
jgi:hypothetical protein